ncbi:MAG TPA: 3-methyl-2-oxobutanoate hydroxymethyltransferase, partial [Porticoccus sp.]|nr:3-methyl-2-oxobutanoate hydroxymethyltransferase [Porticoccus sp.]
MKTVTINTLNTLKEQGEKFPVITAYDASFARLIEHAGIEVVLVGDSLGNVIQGYDSTVPVTMDDMIYHVEACLLYTS